MGKGLRKKQGRRRYIFKTPKKIHFQVAGDRYLPAQRRGVGIRDIQIALAEHIDR
jgi:hypothetical protein